MTDDHVAARPRKVTPAQAAGILAERDPVIARLVADAGLPSFARPTETHFTALVRPIIYQQLAGPAARAIYGRMVTPSAVRSRRKPSSLSRPRTCGPPGCRVTRRSR
jgi:hypothetical protein